MRSKHLLPTLLVLAGTFWVLADEIEQTDGILSYIDTTLPYHVEIVHRDTHEACAQAGLYRCEADGEAVVYRQPIQLEEQALEAQDDIDEAWDRFYDRVVNEVHGNINRFPPCWNPLASCGAHIDWGCVFSRQVEAVAEAFVKYQPEYWIDVTEAIVSHLPFSLWWQGVMPLQDGAVIAAITARPNPGQYLDLVNTAQDPRAPAYYFQPPVFPWLPVPHLHGELGIPEYPGIVSLEEAKRQLEQASVWEYQQYGFVTFWQAWGDFEDTLFMRWPPRRIVPMPSIVGSVCLIPTFPFIAVVPFVPVPTFVPRVPKTFYGFEAVPEGYDIPRLEAEPLFALPDLNELLAGAPEELPNQPPPGAIEEMIPCLPEEVDWPPPGFDGNEDDLGPQPDQCPPGTPVPPELEPDNGNSND